MKKTHLLGVVLGGLLALSLGANTAKADAITLSGTFNTTFTVNCLNADCSKFEAPYTGTGTIVMNGSTLSNVAVSSSQVVDFSLAVPSLAGTITFTAAGGDKLLISVSGVPGAPSNGSASLVGLSMVITGGTGVFAGLTGTLPITAGAATFTSQAGGVGQFTFNGTASPVPEPATLLLLGTGLTGIVARIRYRKAKQQKAD